MFWWPLISGKADPDPGWGYWLLPGGGWVIARRVGRWRRLARRLLPFLQHHWRHLARRLLPFLAASAPSAASASTTSGHSATTWRQCPSLLACSTRRCTSRWAPGAWRLAPGARWVAAGAGHHRLAALEAALPTCASI